MNFFRLISFFGCISSGLFLHSQTFSSTPNLTIADFATTDYTLTVSGLNPQTLDTVNFGLETVCIDLTHTWDADLDIFLIAPDGTMSRLVSGQGGSDDNYTNTCFNNNAPLAITAGSAPFTGIFRPMGQMGLVNNGQNGNGIWTLRITDTYPADNGVLLSWNITFGNNPASYFGLKESSLPIFVLNTNGQSIPDEPKIMASMGVIWNGDGNRNYLTDPFNHYNGKVGIETRGASSGGFPKKSYDIELWDINGNDIDSALCGMPSENDWVLSAQYTDKSLMRAMLTFHIYRLMGWYAPRFKPVELIIDGEYLGVYILMEKVKRDNNRINISKLLPTDISGDNLTGGYILKLDKNSGSSDPGWNSNYLPWPAGDSIYINYYYPDGADIMPQQADYIKAYVDSFETALIGPNFIDSTLGYRKFLDINSCVDAFIVQELSKSIDAYRKSFYMYKNKNSNGGKMIMAPIWDYDLTYGNVDFCDGMNYTGWQYNFNYVCGNDYWLNPFWFERMTQDSVFNQQVRCRWENLRTSILSQNYLYQWIDSVSVFLTESQSWNFTVWPIMGSYVWPNFYVAQDYQSEVDTLKWWLNERMLWLDANLGGNPAACSTVGIDWSQQIEKGIEVFPNPFTTTVSVRLGNNYKVSAVSVFDAGGREYEVKFIFVNSTTLLPDLKNISTSGVYILKMETNLGAVYKKIVKY